jgi:hypothetical protein
MKFNRTTRHIIYSGGPVSLFMRRCNVMNNGFRSLMGPLWVKGGSRYFISNYRSDNPLRVPPLRGMMLGWQWVQTHFCEYYCGVMRHL